MESSVERVLVLGAAPVAHDKFAHRRSRAIVCNVLDDREEGATVGAVDERITVTPIVRVEKFSQAFIASCDVRRNRYDLLDCHTALDNTKVAVVGRKQIAAAFNRFDECERRRAGSQVANELFNRLSLAFHLYHNARRIIEHPASQDTPTGKRVDIRPKPHTLHDPPHQYLCSCCHKYWKDEG